MITFFTIHCEESNSDNAIVLGGNLTTFRRGKKSEQGREGSDITRAIADLRL